MRALLITAALLFIGALFAPSDAEAAPLYFCNCDTGAQPFCDNGSDANPGTNPAAPKQSAAEMRSAFNSMAAGDFIYACQGGYWTASGNMGGGAWSNANCTEASPCTLATYEDDWGGGGTRPVFELTQNNGQTDTLVNTLTDNPIDAYELAGGCPSIGSGPFQVWIEDNTGTYHHILGGDCSAGVVTPSPPRTTFSSQGNQADFSGSANANAGNTVTFWGPPEGTLLNFPTGQGYTVDGFHMKGPVDWTSMSTDGGTGIYLGGEDNHTDYFVFNNNYVEGFGNGMNIRWNNDESRVAGAGWMTGHTITNNTFTHNTGAGVVGGATDSLYEGNQFLTNGIQLALEHNLYVSRTAHRSVYRNNIFTDGDRGVGPDCTGVSVIVHGNMDDLVFEDNTFTCTAAAAGGSGLSIDPGYPSAESFNDLIVRRNTFVGFGNMAVGGDALINPIFENNKIYVTTAGSAGSRRGIRVPSASAANELDADNTGVIIRNNSILYASGADGTAIQFVAPAVTANNVIVSNAIDHLGPDSGFNCFSTIDMADFAAFDYNICNSGAGGYGRTGTPNTNSLDADPGFTDTTISGIDIDTLDFTSDPGGTQNMEAAGDPSNSALEDFVQVARGASPDVGAHQETNALAVPQWGGANLDSQIGINLEWNRYEKPGVTFANAMKTARPWQRDAVADALCDDASGGFTGPSNSDGYPTGLDGNDCIYTEFFTGAHADGAWPLGEWEIEWDGTATWSVSGAATDTITASGDLITVGTTTGGIRLNLESVGSDLTDVRLHPPGGICQNTTTLEYDYGAFCGNTDCPGGVASGCPDQEACGAGESCIDLADAWDDGVLFHPLWMQRLGQYRMLRMMNWLHTNHTTIDAVSDYRPNGFYTYSYSHNAEFGVVPLEVVAQACNHLNAACYVNVPLLMPDAEITEFVEFFRDNVNSWLPVYVELSNEVWNSQFAQHDQAADAAFTKADFSGNTSCDPSGRTDPETAACARQFHAARTVEMCDLAEAAFDATGEDSRLHCVFGYRNENSGTNLTTALNCSMWDDGPCDTNGGNVDILAINGYIGNNDPNWCTTTVTSEQDICDEMADDINIRFWCTGAGCPITELTTVLSTEGVDWPLMVYEGGMTHGGTGGSSGFCDNLVLNSDGCHIGQLTALLDRWDLLADTFNLETFVLFDNSGMLWDGAAGSLYGHRGSNEGSWTKEHAVVEWDNQAGNQCEWLDCELATEAPPEPPVVLPDGSLTSGGFGAGAMGSP